MAVSLGVLDNLMRYGTIRRGGSLLDVGTSNIYGVTVEGLVGFLRRFDCAITPEVIDFARDVEAGSGRGPDGVALNQAWLGQILHAIGMRYESIDIAVGYLTRVVDLNRHGLPTDMIGSFDMVLNCGTTEHIFHQYNAFRCIHDAARVGGLMVHQLPSSGFTNHCYFCYTPRFFFDLAAYNEYELVDFWLEGPDGYDKMYAAVRDYASVYPILGPVVERIGREPRETAIEEKEIPNNSVNAIFRKKNDMAFRGMLELSTSWGAGGSQDAHEDVKSHY